uniref:FAD dependent oxidoreductase domain-containing protein n=1 Tax=Scylla olivacea TaxID=85551 RepID=A0A0P4WD52_SCYOL
MLPTSISSCGVLGRLKTNVSKLYMLWSSQQVANSRRGLSLSCQTYESKKDDEDLGTEKEKVEQKFRKYEYSNPYERAFGILKDDVASFYKKRKKFFEDIITRAQSNAEAKAKPAPKNIYGFEPSGADVGENVWPSFCDVLVVGGGAMGSSVAYHLKEKARGGLNVVVVEEDPGVSYVFSLFCFITVSFTAQTYGLEHITFYQGICILILIQQRSRGMLFYV